MRTRAPYLTLFLALAGCDSEMAERPTLVEAATAAGVPTEEWGSKRVLFGHQSVGGNVLAGISEMAGSGELPAVIEFEGGAPSEPGIHHFKVGRNGYPEDKLDAFAEMLNGLTVLPDAALMKFCYVDVNADTDPDRLFEAYRTRMAELKERHPDLRLVHVTLPLTADRGTLFHWRTALRGNDARSDRRLNSIRHRYNELLRAEYAGREPVFDLARIESTRPDGSIAAVRYDGSTVPVLASEYTNDGGHLNAEGRRRAAAALLATLQGI